MCLILLKKVGELLRADAMRRGFPENQVEATYHLLGPGPFDYSLKRYSFTQALTFFIAALDSALAGLATTNTCGMPS